LYQSACGSSHWQQLEKIVIQPTSETCFQGAITKGHQVAEPTRMDQELLQLSATNTQGN